MEHLNKADLYIQNLELRRENDFLKETVKQLKQQLSYGQNATLHH